MKRSLKKFMGLSLALILAVASLSGCGSKDSGTKDNSSSANDNTAGDNTTGDNTDNSASAETFLIGGIGPLTGDAASYGTSVKQGAEVAIKEINEAGGVKVGDKTFTLKLQFEDDEATPENAVTAFNTLMDAGMNALMGTVTSGAGLAIKDLTAQENILQLTPSGSAADLLGNSNAFRLCFTDPLQGVTMANLAKELGYNKIAVIYNNSDEYSTGMMQAFVDQVKANGATIVSSESFVKGDVDFKTQLTAIKATDAQAIFVPAYYQDAAYITTQASELGMKLPFLGGDGWDGVIAQTVDPAVLEGSIFLTPFFANSDNAMVKDFVAKYNTAYGATPDQFAADGYDSIYVIKSAMEKAGSTESADMIAAMTQITVDGLTGKITFGADGEPDKAANFVVIKGGEYTAK